MPYAEPAKFWGTAGLALLLIVVGLGAYVHWSLRHMHFDFLPTAIALDKLTGGCLPPVDQTSLGDREGEAEMSYIAGMQDLYRTRIGTPPSSLTDLNKLPEFAQADGLNGHQFEKDCSIYVAPTGYVVNCGPSQLSSADIAAFVGKAPFARKFYVLGRSEILYVPAPRC